MASCEQVVAENMFDGKPFGHVNDDWQRLRLKMIAGDELWYFDPPSADSHQIWGVALVRNGEIVSTVITAVD